ncbi:hypothetical protein NUKP2_13920 [Klebsiella quasipneumoniae]|nr:hypothetical protein NUKP2_13920 [Klebsiella quasipneumoniae]
MGKGKSFFYSAPAFGLFTRYSATWLTEEGLKARIPNEVTPRLEKKQVAGT